MENLIDDYDELLNVDARDQYFLFKSGGDTYALPALSVSEIVEYQNITKVPMMNSYVKGVINVRGSLVGVVDLLDRFGLMQTVVGERTSLAIIKTQQLDKEHLIAILIDEIYEVDGLDSDSIKETPPFGMKIPISFIQSMAKYNGKDIMILNFEEILRIDELCKIKDS